MWKEKEKMVLACDQHRLVARLSPTDSDALLNLKRQLKRVQIESGSSKVLLWVSRKAVLWISLTL